MQQPISAYLSKKSLGMTADGLADGGDEFAGGFHYNILNRTSQHK